MSEDQKPTEPVEVPEVVSKEAYSKVSTDMHKFKTEAKALASKLADVQAEQEAKEKASLEEKEQWHALYKKSEQKLKDIETERVTEKSKFIESHKINAVIQNLGGFKKPEYNRFIDSSKVAINEDGSIDDTSVNSEVERLKREYPELVKSKSATPLPANAPVMSGLKAIKDMSSDERAAAIRAALIK
jgi:hypothetical protein